MAGYTAFTSGLVNNRTVLIPMTVVRTQGGWEGKGGYGEGEMEENGTQRYKRVHSRARERMLGDNQYEVR
jgi:hypothetical protein